MSPGEQNGRPLGKGGRSQNQSSGRGNDPESTIDQTTDAEDLEARFEAAYRRIHDRRRTYYRRGENYRTAFHTHWHAYDVPGTRGTRRPIHLPDNWPASIRGLYLAGLTLPELRDSVDVAMGTPGLPERSIFRYTMGVAWRRIKLARQEAADLARGGGAT